MKTLITITVALILSSVAWGQTSVTYVDKNGQKTEVTVSCTQNGDCRVWDSTNDIHFSWKEKNKIMGWCWHQHIKTTRADGQFEDYNLRPSPCDVAWQRLQTDKCVSLNTQQCLDKIKQEVK